MRDVIVLGLGVLAAASGCGPIEYMNQVGTRASTAVTAAKNVQADRYAPYEFTLAQEYLHQARVEAGYSQFQAAIDYGHKAEDSGRRAEALARQRRAVPPPLPPGPASGPPAPAAPETHAPTSGPEAAPPPAPRPNPVSPPLPPRPRS